MFLGTLRASLNGYRHNYSRPGFLMPSHPLMNLEIQKYYQNEPKLNGIYSRNNLPKIKDGVHVIILDEFKSIATHWIELYAICNNIIYFDRFAIEHIPQKIKNIRGHESIITNIYRIQVYDSKICGWFLFIRFIDFILKGKIQLYCTNLFCRNDYEKIDKVILKCFQ